jgi:acyl-CoA thioesterase-2
MLRALDLTDLGDDRFGAVHQVIPSGRAYGGETLAQAVAATTRTVDGVGHHAPMPEGLPDPESLPTSEQAVDGAQVRDGDYWSRERNFDVRHVEDPVYVTHARQTDPRQVVWVKAFDRLPDDPVLHQIALAYSCDYTLLEPVLRAHGAAWSDDGVVTASLDHAMWWHTPGRADEWVALVQDSPEAGNGLASTRMSLYSRSGDLLVTVAQQGLVSLPER